MKIHIPQMIQIPAGSFRMGLPPFPKEAALARRWHSGKEVSLRAFAIGKFPVTNEEYRDYLRECGTEPLPTSGRLEFSAADQPVGGVSWLDAQAYCLWLTQETGNAFRLPTDSEWEYAARGGREGNAFPWGTELNPQRACYGGQPAPKPVGSYPPNDFGLHDMVGNVWEWCSDLFNDVSDGLLATNKPTGNDPALNRVLRGGSYLTQDPLNLWMAYRHEDPPELRHECIGFRVTRSLL